MSTDRDHREEILRAALRQSRWNLALSLLLFLGTAAGLGYVYSVVRSGDLFREQRLFDEATQRLDANMDAIVAEAGDLAADVLSSVADATEEQFEEDAATYVRVLDRESGALIDHLAESLASKARSQVREHLADHRRVFREEFPKISDPKGIDRMMAEIDRALDRLTRRYYVDEFRSVSQEVVAAWRAIPPAPRRPGDPPRERLLAALVDWAEHEFTESGRAAAAAKKGGE